MNFVQAMQKNRRIQKEISARDKKNPLLALQVKREALEAKNKSYEALDNEQRKIDALEKRIKDREFKGSFREKLQKFGSASSSIVKDMIPKHKPKSVKTISARKGDTLFGSFMNTGYYARERAEGKEGERKERRKNPLDEMFGM